MSKRVDSLNFIRILGMTMILLFHAKLMYGFSLGHPWPNRMISIGAVFVTVFFMLSGFGLRKSNRDLSIRDVHCILQYYKKRVLSIYPLFLLLSVVALIFQFRVADSVGETLALLPIQFSMLHILLGKDMHWFLFNDNCWYISALFVLYLLFPVLNSFVNRLHVWVKIWSCVILWLVSVGMYSYCVYGTELVFLDYYPNPFLRIPEFLIGMMMADITEEVGEKNWLNEKRCMIFLVVIMIISTIGLYALQPHFIWETNLYNILVIPCTAFIFLCMANSKWLNQVGSSKLIRWWAGLGLEIYLCQSFATLVLTYVKIDGKWDEVVFILLTVAFAVVMNSFITKPILKLARK